MSQLMEPIDTVVFDFGNVLIRWDPRNLYRKMFGGRLEEMERFLTTVCTMDWNHRLDIGEPFDGMVEALAAEVPQYANEIKAYHHRWDEMLGEPIEENVALMRELKSSGYKVYGLSNWSAEKFPVATKRHQFFAELHGTILSGNVGVGKPDSRIYELLFQQFKINPFRAAFVDDLEKNIVGAQKFGLHGVLYSDPVTLRRDLKQLGVTIR